jgi:hypothetical protein
MAVTALEEFLAEATPQQIVGEVQSEEIYSRLNTWVSGLNDVLSRIDPADFNDEVLDSLRAWLEKLIRDARKVAKGVPWSSGFSISVEERVVVAVDFSLTQDDEIRHQQRGK